MPDIHIHRKHQLGLPRARALALQWAEEVEQKFDMECTLLEGETSDTLTFKRIGVSGTLEVTGSHFELDAKLGFLLGAFAKTIESEIERNLDQLLADQGRAAAKSKGAAKDKAGAQAPAKAPRKSGKTGGAG
jgi:putative polyhydroxyalkanoate system protein